LYLPTMKTADLQALIASPRLALVQKQLVEEQLRRREGQADSLR